MQRPQPGDANAFFFRYIDLVPDGPILPLLAEQAEDSKAFLDRITEEQAGHRYAPEKWTIRQVVGHMIDTERVMAFRALHFARGASDPVPGMDENAWAAAAPYDQIEMAALAEEFYLTRAANLAMFDAFDDSVLPSRGVANGSEATVQSLLYIIAGHTLHHQNVLRERYFTSLPANG